MKLSSVTSFFYDSQKDSSQETSSRGGFSGVATSSIAIAAVGAGMTLARHCPLLKPQTVVGGAMAVLAVGICAKKLISHLPCFSNKPSIPRFGIHTDELINEAESSIHDQGCNPSSHQIELDLDVWVSKSDGPQHGARLIAKERILECYLNREPSIDLSGLGLTSLPVVFAGFSGFLTHLNLSGNSLLSVPSEILQLTQLRVLSLSHNPISFLPVDIHQLKSLEQLDLLGMNLLKRIPDCIGNMENLLCRWDLSEGEPILTEMRENWLSIAKNVIVYGDRFTLFTADRKHVCVGTSPYPKLFPPPKPQVQEVPVVPFVDSGISLKTLYSNRCEDNFESYFD